LATNFFFNNFQNSQEQILIEDLIIESIKIYGLDVIYIPRNPVAIDPILNEDPMREYIHAVPVEMYVKNVDGFQGDGDFMSKFGLQIRDQITFCIARRIFNNEVGSIEYLDRPQEGDLIYLPFNRKIFEIRFVEHEAIFYQLGALQMYELRCELFEYSNEFFNTGVADVDRLYTYSASPDAVGLVTEDGYSITDEDGFVIVQEEYALETYDAGASNIDIETVADTFIDFTERDPFSEGTY
jgi:hypothetical protein